MVASLTKTTTIVSCWQSPCLDSQGWRQDTACPSVLASVTSVPRVRFLFPYQLVKGVSQIAFASQSNTHFLKSQPLRDLRLNDLTPTFGRMKVETVIMTG